MNRSLGAACFCTFLWQKCDLKVAPSLQELTIDVGVLGPWGLRASECEELDIPMRWGSLEHLTPGKINCELTQGTPGLFPPGHSLPTAHISQVGMMAQARLICRCHLHVFVECCVLALCWEPWGVQWSILVIQFCLYGIQDIFAEIEKLGL